MQYLRYPHHEFLLEKVVFQPDEPEEFHKAHDAGNYHHLVRAPEFAGGCQGSINFPIDHTNGEISPKESRVQGLRKHPELRYVVSFYAVYNSLQLTGLTEGGGWLFFVH